MKSLTRSAIAVAAMTAAALGLAGPVEATPSTPIPLQPAAPIPLQPGDEPMPGADGSMVEGDAAMMMVSRMMYDCMWGGEPGIPQAVRQDRGVQFVCMH